MRRWIRAIAGAMCLLGPMRGGAEPPSPELGPGRPIPWQDTGAFAQPFLQLPFDAPAPVGRGDLEVSLRTLYSSTIARERAAGLSVDVSVESAVPTFFVRYGLPSGFELQLSVPGALHHAGFLGRPIKFVEGLFGTSNPLRAGRPPAAAHFRIVRADGSGLDWSGNGGSAGDPWVGVKRRARVQDGWAPAVSWRAAIKVPAAPLPWGSGLLEVGTGLVAGWTVGATSVLLEADVMIPERRPITAAGLQTRPHYTVQLGAAGRATSWLTWMLQASAHTSAIVGTGLHVVDGTSTYLLAGLGTKPTRRTSVTFALVENVFPAWRGADITGVLEISWRR